MPAPLASTDRNGTPPPATLHVFQSSAALPAPTPARTPVRTKNRPATDRQSGSSQTEPFGFSDRTASPLTMRSTLLAFANHQASQDPLYVPYIPHPFHRPTSIVTGPRRHRIPFSTQYQHQPQIPQQQASAAPQSPSTDLTIPLL
jgi:hypothetical protein